MLARVAVVLLIIATVFGVASRLRQRLTPVLESGPSYRPRGAFHVRADVQDRGLGTLDILAARARAAGLSFVVVTDPNAQLAGPVVRDGVAILSYAELTTQHGLVVALGSGYVLPPTERVAPAVFSGIRALGGLPVVSHPSDPKLPWTGPLEGAGGIEIASFTATARRVAGPFSFGLLPLVVAAQANRRLALAQAYDRDRDALSRWDEQTANVVGFCGAGTIGSIDADQDLSTWNIILDGRLPEDASQRPAAILEQLSRGAFFCAAGLFGEAPYFEFGARRGNEWTGRNGDIVRDVDATELTVLGPNTSIGVPVIALMRGGQEVARVHGRELRYRDPKPGVYRVEVRVPVPYLFSGERAVPVIYSNRIRVVSTLFPGLMENHDDEALLP